MPNHYLVIDVESIGLHGQAYTVGGCVLDAQTGKIMESLSFRYACNPDYVDGREEDRQWVMSNIPRIMETHPTPRADLNDFWWKWQSLQKVIPGIAMAAECGWPVEANFLEACIKQNEKERCFQGPYPLHEIASFMVAAGMDPMATYERDGNELPKHDPLADANQSARLLFQALSETRANRLP